MRRFPPPWTVEKIPGGYKVIDSTGQSLAYVYSRDNASDAIIANATDEARRIASNIAKLQELPAPHDFQARSLLRRGISILDEHRFTESDAAARWLEKNDPPRRLNDRKLIIRSEAIKRQRKV